MVSIRKASEKDIRIFVHSSQSFWQTRKCKIFQDNVVKFGIPDKYVKKVLAVDRLLEAMSLGEYPFYGAVENNEIGRVYLYSA